jgi:predicted PurR-regulated permease PerM
MNQIFSRNYIFFIAATILCGVVLFPFLFPILAGVTIAFLCEPLSLKIISLLNSDRPIWKWLVPLTVLCVILFAIIGPVLTLLTTGIQELISVINVIQDNVKKEDLFHSVQKLRDVLNHFGLRYSINEIIEKGTDFAKTASRSGLAEMAKALTATPEFILKVFLFLITWFFFLVHGKEYRSRFLTKIIPWEKERIVISKTVSGVLKALIVANVLVAMIQAMLISTTLGFFGVPRYILLGMIAFFLSFIPILGTAPLMLAASAWCYFSESRPAAAIGILIAAVVVGFIDNILRPLFMKGGVQISFFWIFLAVIGGMSTFGISGAVLGPVIFALFAGTLKALER